MATALITTNQFAEMLNISTRQLHRMRSKGTIIQPIKLGRMDRNRDLVLEWLNSAVSQSGSSSDADGVGSEAQLSPEDSGQFDVSALPPVVIPGWPGLGNHGNGSVAPLASEDSGQSGMFTLLPF